MNNLLRNGLSWLQSLPGKVWLWISIGFVVLVVALKFFSKSTSINAKDLNLKTLIDDAITNLKVKQNQDKIKELEKKTDPNSLDSDPEKVLKFYKDRKKDLK